MEANTLISLINILKNELASRGFFAQKHSFLTFSETIDYRELRILDEVNEVRFEGKIVNKTINVTIKRGVNGKFVAPDLPNSAFSGDAIDDSDLFLYYRHFIVNESLAINP